MRKQTDFDAVAIGAGIGGLYAVHKLREEGYSVRAFETGSDVGGTWYWNKYPGARCDVDSIYYSYTFSEEITQEWTWSKRYAEQPEILEYLNYVADKLDLRKDIQFKTRIESAHWDEENHYWRLTLDDESVVTSRYFILTSGPLSTANVPAIKGLDNFKGEWYHTGNWPKEEVSLKGKKVGVIGTGSTGVGVIPAIAPEVEQLSVFQRTPQYSTPAGQYTYTPEQIRDYKANAHIYKKLSRTTNNAFGMDPGHKSVLDDPDEKRFNTLEKAWQLGGHNLLNAYNDILVNPESNMLVADFLNSKIKNIVKDPETAKDLTPDYYYGVKRPVVDTGYFETFNRDNVELVNVKKHPIQEITENGIRTTEGFHELDVIIFATGYDAITGTLFNMDIRGLGGVSLKDKWENGENVTSYLGLGISGFPNMYMTLGPKGQGVFGSAVITTEENIDWMANLMNYAYKEGIAAMDVDTEVEAEWCKHVEETADNTLMNKLESWFSGSNVDGKPKPRGYLYYLGGIPKYIELCTEEGEKGYPSFNRLGKLQTEDEEASLQG